MAAILATTFCYGSGEIPFILTDEFEEDLLFTQLCAEGEALCEELAESLGEIERGDFDPDGVALFDSEVDECDEVLLPWAFDQYAGNEIRSKVEEGGLHPTPVSEEELGAVLESNPYNPTFEGEITFFAEEKVADSIAKVAPREEKCPCNPRPRPRPKVMESHPVEQESIYTHVEVEEKAPKPQAVKSKKKGRTRVIRRLR